MLLLRRAASAIGPRARTLLPISATPAAATRYFSVTAWLKEADSTPSTGGKPAPNTLWSPWRISDLGWEAKLYEKYGPNYIDHVDAKKQDLIRRRVEVRKQIEAQLKAELSDESDAWYEVLQEANKRQHRFSASVVDEFRRRRKELGPVVKGKETPQQRRLAEEMRAWSLVGQREKNLEFRRQVVGERRKQS